MARRKQQNYELIDSLYSLVVVGAIIVWAKTSNIYLALISFSIFLIILFGAIAYYKKLKRKKLLASGIDIVDKMDGVTFEKFLLEHFKKQGYKGKLTPITADYGADLILKKDGRVIVVQAKRWNNNVGIKAVQEIVGAIKHYNADKGMVITNSKFTENAYNLAESNGIELWDRKKLTDFLSTSKGRDSAVNAVHKSVKEELAVASEELCPICSSRLIIRDGRRGKFWGCTGFPKCRYTRDYVEHNKFHLNDKK